MNIRKARAWATLWMGVLIVVLALIVEVLTMPKYNNYDLPELPTSEYKNAYIAVSGDTAYLYFVDKKGYIEVDPNGLGNTYTLGLTTTDPYDESKILFAEKYTATIGGDTWTAEELPDLSGVYDIPAYAQFSLPCEIGGPHWSNVTLLDQDGNVFIEGSEPIDAGKAASRRYSFTLGYLLAQCGPPLKLPDKQPTAYSYNGVVLPKLPEWDKTVYPYAIIYTDTQSNKECLFVAKVPSILYDNSGNGNYTFSAANGWGGSNPIKFENDGTNWVDGFLFPQHIYASTYIWSNYDIKDPKGFAGPAGSVYRYGSDPIPVYEQRS